MDDKIELGTVRTRLVNNKQACLEHTSGMFYNRTRPTETSAPLTHTDT